MNRKYIHLSVIDLYYGTRARINSWITTTLWTHTQRALHRTQAAYDDYNWAVEPFRHLIDKETES